MKMSTRESLAVRRDTYNFSFEQLNIIFIDEVAALITIDYLWPCLLKNLFEAAQEKIFLQGCRQFIVIDQSAVQVNNSEQVHGTLSLTQMDT